MINVLKKTILVLSTLFVVTLPTNYAHAYKISHSMGVTDIKSAKRIVVLTNEGTEALLALGIKPIGAVNSWIGEPFYPHLTKQLNGVTPLGKENMVDIEAIARLKPDLIIGNKQRQEKLYDVLSYIAPTVFSKELKGQWKNNFKLYAQATQTMPQYKKVMAKYYKKTNALKSKKIQEKISIIRFLPAQVRIYKKDSFSGVILNDAGFLRTDIANTSGFTEKITNKERISEFKGDRIFYFTYENGDGKGLAFEKEWVNTTLWHSLKAVKNKKVNKVSDIYWNTSGGVISAHKMLDDLLRFYK